MKGSRTRTSRLWVTVLVLNLVHAPFPVCDGNDAIAVTSLGLTADAHPGLEEDDFDIEVWILGDVDFIFLGCDPPEDADEGPIDKTPDELPHCYVTSLDSHRPLARSSGEKPDSLHCGLWSDISLTVGADGLRWIAFLPQCYRNVGSTFSTANTWRFFLSVITC